MNKITLLPFFLLLFFSAKAQDKIISVKHDTIHCRIISITSERILYELKNNDGSVTGKAISLAQVEAYSSLHQPGKNSKTDKLCLGLNVGRSTMPWYFDDYQSSYKLPDFYNHLKTGLHISANAYYKVKPFLGLGVEYSFFKTSASGSLPGEGYYSSIYIMESEKYRQYINYLGASVLFQQYLDVRRKLTLNEYLSIGVLFIRLEYQNTYPYVSQSDYYDISSNMLLTGNSFSGKMGLSAEYRLFKAISVGLGGDFLWGVLKRASIESKGADNSNYTADNQKLANAMKLSRMDYSFILRYYF